MNYVSIEPAPLSDAESFELFASLDTPPVGAATTPPPEWVARLRSWRNFECDKIQADIYRAQERY